MSSETARLELPLVQPAQAQKHVTVNEALMRIDGMVNLVLQSVDRVSPPPANDGDCWSVPPGGTGAWAGQSGKIAVASNGGWVFVPCARGMRAFIADRGAGATHDGSGWQIGAVSMSPMGSALLMQVLESEVTVPAGAEFDTGLHIPAGAMVLGATARVTQALRGSLTSWKLGTGKGPDQFGHGLGLDAGSWARSFLGAPTTFYSAEPIVVTAQGGAFESGKIVIAVHFMFLKPQDVIPSA